MPAPSDYHVLFYGYGAGLAATKLKHFGVQDAPNFSPRISSTQGETDLDGTLHYTFPVDHGFKKVFSDDNKNYRVYGNYNPVDGNLYPTIVPSSISTGSTYLGSSGYFSAKVSTHKATYLAYRENTTNVIYYVDTAGTRTTLTLPAALSSSSTQITGMAVHKTYLYISSMSTTASPTCYRFAIDTAAWQDISGSLYKFFTIRDLLFGLDISGRIWRVTNEEAAGAATYTQVTTTDSSAKDWDQTLDVVSFNGAAWISKASGLFRFDGTSAVRIFTKRFNYLTEHQGALYMENGGWLYRFTGSLIEKLQYFGPAELITDIQSHQDNLYILTSTNATTYKYAGSPSDGTIDHRIFEYDGVNFRVIYEADQSNPSWLLSSVGNLLIRADGSSAAAAATLFKFDMATRYQATTSSSQQCYVMTADFDGDLPNIRKILRAVEIDTANASSGDTLTITYERYLSGTWSTVSGSLTLTNLDTTRAFLRLPEDFEPQLFERIRLRITLTPAVGSSVSLVSSTIHYTLHPRRRKQFTLGFTLQNYNEYTEVAPDADGSGTNYPFYSPDWTLVFPEQQAFYLDDLFDSDNGHFYFAGPQYTTLKTTITSSATSMTLNGSIGRPLSAGQQPLALIIDPTTWDYEIVSYTISSLPGTTTTTFSSMTRGLANTASYAWTAGALVYPCYEIARAETVNEVIDLSPGTFLADTSGAMQLQRDLQLRLTEV